MSVLHVDSVMKSYGLRTVLSDIYLSCVEGEIVGLLGRNGCGKSTLLKIIFGSLKADNKFVKVGGKRIISLADGYGLINICPRTDFYRPVLK